MHYQTEGIILQSTKYKDNDYMVHIFTQEFGKVSYAVHSPQSKKACVKCQHLQPFSLVQLEVEHRENREVQRICEAKLDPCNCQILEDPLKITIALFLAEVVNKSLESTNEDDQLYHFLQQAVHALAEAEKVGNFPLFFLIHYAKLLGIYPEDLSENEYIRYLEPVDRATFLHILLEPSKATAVEKRQGLRLLLSYYQYFLPGMGKIKSLDVLVDVFAE